MRRDSAKVRAASLIVGAKNDHVVTLAGVRELHRRLSRGGKTRLVTLEQGFHIIPRDRGAERALGEVAGFFEEHRALSH